MILDSRPENTPNHEFSGQFTCQTRFLKEKALGRCDKTLLTTYILHDFF